MKRYLVNGVWNRDFRRFGFKNSYRHYFDTIEEAEEYIKEKNENEFCKNQQWQIKDRELKKVIKSGHTELDPSKYGY